VIDDPRVGSVNAINKASDSGRGGGVHGDYSCHSLGGTLHNTFPSLSDRSGQFRPQKGSGSGD
jgi:hypothetical protein